MVQRNFVFEALLGKFLNIICKVWELESGIHERKDTIHTKRQDS